MKLYRLDGLYYEKQADLPKGQLKAAETVEFPFAASPKADFVSWLNEFEQRGLSLPAPVQEDVPPAPPPPRWNGSPELVGEGLTRRLEAADHTTRLIAMQSDRLALELVIDEAPPAWLDTIIGLATERKARTDHA